MGGCMLPIRSFFLVIIQSYFLFLSNKSTCFLLFFLLIFFIQKKSFKEIIPLGFFLILIIQFVKFNAMEIIDIFKPINIIIFLLILSLILLMINKILFFYSFLPLIISLLSGKNYELSVILNDGYFYNFEYWLGLSVLIYSIYFILIDLSIILIKTKNKIMRNIMQHNDDKT